MTVGPQAAAGTPGSDPAGPALTRRGLLRRAAGVAALVGLGGAAWAVRGYRLDPARAARLRCLTALELVVLEAAFARVLDGLDADAPAEAAAWVDGWLSRRPAWAQREVRALIVGLELAPPAAIGRLGRFTRLAPEAQDRVLRAWETAPVPLLRHAFAGLKGLAVMGAYGRPATLAAIGYDGPLAPGAGR